MNTNKLTNRFVISVNGIKNKTTNEFVNKKGERFIYNQYVIFTQLKEKFENMKCFQEYKSYTNSNIVPKFCREFSEVVTK